MHFSIYISYVTHLFIIKPCEETEAQRGQVTWLGFWLSQPSFKAHADIREPLTETVCLWPCRIITAYMSYLTLGGPMKEHRTEKLEELGRGQSGEEMPTHNMYCWAPRNPCARNHLDWEMHPLPGVGPNMGTSKVTGQRRSGQLNPSPWNLRPRATWRGSSLGFPYFAVLCCFPIRFFALSVQYVCLLR